MQLSVAAWHPSFMPNRNKHKERPKDINQLAHYLVEVSTQNDASIALPTQAQVSALMAELGRRGGKIGGKRRLETMTAKDRSAVAKRAALARWSKK